ncbi:MAG: 4-alpha-glucanotransferase [Gammaproteobacteria bacterium]|nr:4-alpha-glucanotransferase [Gammaproteobacteria bacterium]
MNSSHSQDLILRQRRAGVLLHPSSLPGKQPKGNIGQEALNFLHFIKNCGLSVWQMLPLGPTHADGSPYQCLSVHAGNPELIDLDWLVKQGWLEETDCSYQDISASLEQACQCFFNQSRSHWHQSFDDFVDQHKSWLHDYALFQVLKKIHANAPWNEWPEKYRLCEPNALKEVGTVYHEYYQFIQFSQFIFFTQWQELREQAMALGILLFGDIPIYVAPDSADVWSYKNNFLMNQDGRCEFVAGVPPDAFSEDGQLWGNPLYDWDQQKKNNFNWWVERFKTQLELFDILRLDHFRGLESCWQIPADAQTAVDGHWAKTPGYDFLNSIENSLGKLPLVAEDLGVITQEVIDLRETFNLPGMAVLHFAFDGHNDNLYLPHNHVRNSVVYTGTHDNDTTLGWYRSLEEEAKKQLHAYLGHDENNTLNMPWDLNRMALSSVASLAMIPMQDLLNLDSNARMNMPGTTENNWSWRFNWSQLWPQLPHDLKQMITLYGRLV